MTAGGFYRMHQSSLSAVLLALYERIVQGYKLLLGIRRRSTGCGD